MKNKFICYVEGYICTTDIDSHGDKLTREAIESIKDQIERDSTLRTMYLRHDKSRSCGEKDLIYKFDLEVDSRLKWEVKDLLDKENLKSEVYIQKALDIPAIISVVTNGLFIVDKLYEYWKKLKKKKQKEQEHITINYFNIVIGDQKFNFDRNSPDEIKKHLEGEK